MAGINKVFLVGNVGKDPELKTTQGGKAVLKFSLATSEKFKNKAGEQQETTEWHRCVCFDKLAETMGRFLEKGKQIFVEGKLKTSSYEKDNVKHYSTDIIVNGIQFLGSKGSGGPRPDVGAAPDTGANEGASFEDTELPF
jgi:single-strand DNA-binding protein